MFTTGPEGHQGGPLHRSRQGGIDDRLIRTGTHRELGNLPGLKQLGAEVSPLPNIQGQKHPSS